MKLVTLTNRHYPALFEVAQRAEPFSSTMTLEQYKQVMSRRQGWALVTHTGEIAGGISFTDYLPQVDVLIHCVVAEKHQRRWCTRNILREIFTYVFKQLGVAHLSAFCIEGKSDAAGEFLEKIGFVCEGTRRKCAHLPDGFFNVKLFGMLREECRWL